MSEDKRQIENAQITFADIALEAHGSLCVHIGFQYGGAAQGLVRIVEGEPGSYLRDFVKGILQAIGVDEFSKLKGKYARVEHSHTNIFRVGHITDDKWFDPDRIK